jgi:hypothetical protein
MNEVHQRRMNKFIEEGLNEQDARSLADQMHRRDTEGFDDRRVCFECTHYVGKACLKIKDKLGKPQMPLRFVLQRCDFFKLKGSK